VITLNEIKLAAPKLVEIATSAASLPRGNDNASNSRPIVPCVECKPATFQEHLEPGTKIHRGGVRRNSNVTKVASAISGGDVHTAAQGHSKVRKVTTHTDHFMVSI
jgi:hypothetical protein